MPLVIANPRGQQDGSIRTQFTDTTNTSSVTYTYPTTQSSLIIENSGERDIFVTVGSVTNQQIQVDKKWKYDGSFTSFSIRSDVNSQEFIATAIYDDSINIQLAERAYSNEFDKNQPRGLNLNKVGMVLKRGIVGSWDAKAIESPVIWFDERKQRYAMVYVGYAADGSNNAVNPKVGLAWSDDLMKWEKDSANPIFGGSGIDGSPDKVGTTGPVIWYENGTYYLFYIGLTGVGYEAGIKTMCLATSTDLYNWTRHPNNPIISPSSNGTGWRSVAIWHSNIVKVDKTYYNFFNASGVINSIDEERIGYATSTNLINWTVDDVNSPLIGQSGVPGSFDELRAGDPSVYKVGNVWYMAYYGVDITGTHGQDGIAWTTEAEFPLNWRRFTGNPVLKYGNYFDDTHAHKPFIFQIPGRHYHFYTAENWQERGIALAIDTQLKTKQTAHKRCTESTRTITTTTFDGVSDTTILMDINHPFLEMRIMVRGMVTGGTLTIQDWLLNNGASITITSAIWSNYVSSWVSVPASVDLKNTALQAMVTAGATGSIGNVEYEFRWMDI